jgi:hypothetical protein
LRKEKQQQQQNNPRTIMISAKETTEKITRDSKRKHAHREGERVLVLPRTTD